MRTSVILGWVCAAAALIVTNTPASAGDTQMGEAQQENKQQTEGTGAPTSPLTTPAMAGPLTANPNPNFIDAGPVGKLYVTGVVSGLGLVQNDVSAGNRQERADLSNAQAFIQKTEGLIQFYLQIGTYSIPAIGTPYLNAGKTTWELYSPIPQVFIKIAPTDEFSIIVGKLPTLIGAEYTFTFENMNVERGLLWNQENAVHRGVQANYKTGPFTFALTLNDGYYSNRFNWLWGSVAYAIDNASTLSFVGGGNLGRTGYSSPATPLFQNNSSIYDLIYTYTTGPWTVTPYFQYTTVPTNRTIGIEHSASTYGAALLASYAFTANLSFAGRAEFIASTGSASDGAPNLLYGPGSKAWSVTLTPTYQYERFFARTEISFIKALDTRPGSALGPNGTKTTQTRLLLETGVLF